MTKEEALTKMRALINFFPAAKTEIEEIIDTLSKPIWYSADEEPPKNTNILIEVSFFKDTLDYYSLEWCTSVCPSWEEYIKEYHVKKWTYIDDILPKGGEE